jgi:hypothetical protein
MDNQINEYNNMYAPEESKQASQAPQASVVSDSPVETFGNLSDYGVNVDLILKSIFFGAIFYLLSLPEVYKLTAGVFGKRVDGVLLHSVVYAVLYYILVHFI